MVLRLAKSVSVAFIMASSLVLTVSCAQHERVATPKNEGAAIHSVEGIGAEITEAGSYITVATVLKNSPAAKSQKIHAGDRLVSLREEGQQKVSLIGVNKSRAAELLRGKAGTTVVLEIIPAGTQQLTGVTLTRERFFFN